MSPHRTALKPGAWFTVSGERPDGSQVVHAFPTPREALAAMRQLQREDWPNILVTDAAGTAIDESHLMRLLTTP